MMFSNGIFLVLRNTSLNLYELTALDERARKILFRIKLHFFDMNKTGNKFLGVDQLNT